MSTTDELVPVRPFWFPADLEFEKLPREFQVAVTEIVVPIYEELVVHEHDPIVRSAGATLAFLTCLEIAQQCEIGANFASALDSKAVEKLTKQLSKLLALSGAKAQIMTAIRRWRESQNREATMSLDYASLRSLVDQCGPALPDRESGENDTR